MYEETKIFSAFNRVQIKIIRGECGELIPIRREMFFRSH